MRLGFDKVTAYALNAMNRLVHARPEGGWIPVGQIAAECELPEAVLRKVLTRLAHAGLVTGTQGKGYTVAARGRNATILDVLRAMDGSELDREGCFTREGPCEFEARCPLRAACGEIRGFLRERLGAIPLAGMPVDPAGIPICFRQPA